MYEKEKLEEAQYFYQRILDEKENPKVLKFIVSAFLSASRSVMQYANEETKCDKSAKQWYDNCMAKSSILTYFKNKRNTNIHSAPAVPSTSVTVEVGTRRVGVKELPASYKVIREGEVIKEGVIDTDQPPPSPKTDASVKATYRHEFKDWPGPEDVITLCKMCLDELEKVVQDGVSKGFIT